VDRSVIGMMVLFKSRGHLVCLGRCYCIWTVCVWGWEVTCPLGS